MNFVLNMPSRTHTLAHASSYPHCVLNLNIIHICILREYIVLNFSHIFTKLVLTVNAL